MVCLTFEPWATEKVGADETSELCRSPDFYQFMSKVLSDLFVNLFPASYSFMLVCRLGLISETSVPFCVWGKYGTIWYNRA